MAAVIEEFANSPVTASDIFDYEYGLAHFDFVNDPSGERRPLISMT